MSREIKSNSKQHIFIYIFYKKEKNQHLKQNTKKENLRVLQKQKKQFIYTSYIYILLIYIKHMYTHFA